MIRQKFLEVLLWIKDHFRFLVEVVVRLSLGIVEKENPNSVRINEDTQKEETHDE